MAVEVLFLFRVALLPVVKVRAVADFVLRDPHHPAEERPSVLTLELVEMLERLEEGGLEDVARLEARPQAASHLQADEREQAGTEPLVKVSSAASEPASASRSTTVLEAGSIGRHLTTRSLSGSSAVLVDKEALCE